MYIPSPSVRGPVALPPSGWAPASRGAVSTPRPTRLNKDMGKKMMILTETNCS